MPRSPEPESSLERREFSAEVIEIPSSADGRAEQPVTTVERAEEIATEVAHAARGAIDAAKRSATEALHTATEALETAERSASEKATRVYREARETAREGYAQASETMQEFARVTSRRARLLKQEHPLRALAILAGVAFLAGMTLRIWRDRRS